MIEALQKYDSVTAAGILSRAALALSHGGSNPAAQPVVADEYRIREQVINALRDELDLRLDDNSEQALTLLGDALDEQAERLLGAVDAESALARLGNRGDLPSDLYVVKFGDDFRHLFGGNNKNETRLVEQTIRHPEAEQHYGLPSENGEPSLVSIFSRRMEKRGKMPEVIYLVIASRKGKVLTVSAAWRINPKYVDIGSAKTLVDLLRLFAESVGVEMEIRGKRGKFIEYVKVDVLGGEDVQGLMRKVVKVDSKDDFYASFSFRLDESRAYAEFSLAYAIDKRKYQQSLY